MNRIHADFAFAGASTDITPAEPVPLAGFSGRPEPYVGIESSLEANAVLLEHDGVRVVLVSADLLFLGPDLVRSVTRRASELGVPHTHVFLSASHTHFAPATDRTKPLLGQIDGRYLATVEARVLALVSDLLSGPVEKVALERVVLDTELNVSRRQSWPFPILTRHGVRLPPNVVLAPAPSGERDGRIELIRIMDENGELRGACWKFACHPVGFPEARRVSAEFPGYVRAGLRARLGRNLPVLFWQGFGGDLRPRITGRRRLSDRIRAAWRGPTFGTASLAQWTSWVECLTASLTEAAEKDGAHPLDGPMRAAAADLPLSVVIESPDSPLDGERSLRIQRLAIGDTELLFVGAEVCSPYATFLHAQGAVHTIGVGYTGDVFGYLPSSRQAAEGGYEAAGFQTPFGVRGRWRPGFEGEVVAATEELRGRSG